MQAWQQHNVNSANTSLLKVEKSEGFVIAILARAARMNDLPFFCFPSLKEGWGTAKPGSELWSTPRSDLRKSCSFLARIEDVGTDVSIIACPLHSLPPFPIPAPVLAQALDKLLKKVIQSDQQNGEKMDEG